MNGSALGEKGVCQQRIHTQRERKRIFYFKTAAAAEVNKGLSLCLRSHARAATSFIDCWLMMQLMHNAGVCSFLINGPIKQ
jgi:hypothetical protein